VARRFLGPPVGRASTLAAGVPGGSGRFENRPQAWRPAPPGLVAAQPGCGSLFASLPATATMGPPATFTSGAPASSKATIHRRPTRAPGRGRLRTSPPPSPGSNLADSTLLELTANGELILAGGSGNGYRLAELMGANNPSGWSGVLKVKTPAGTTLGYILLYSNP